VKGCHLMGVFFFFACERKRKRGEEESEFFPFPSRFFLARSSREEVETLLLERRDRGAAQVDVLARREPEPPRLLHAKLQDPAAAAVAAVAAAIAVAAARARGARREQPGRQHGRRPR